MRISRSVALLALAVSFMSAGTALGGEGVQLKIINDGTQTVMVTLYDNTARPRKAVLENERINGFATLPISVMADDTGMGNITWTAVSSDGTSRKCGRADAHVSDDGTISVKAEDSCSSAPAG